MKKLTYNFKSGHNMFVRVYSSRLKCQLGQRHLTSAIQSTATHVFIQYNNIY